MYNMDTARSVVLLWKKLCIHDSYEISSHFPNFMSRKSTVIVTKLKNFLNKSTAQISTHIHTVL